MTKRLLRSEQFQAAAGEGLRARQDRRLGIHGPLARMEADLRVVARTRPADAELEPRNAEVLREAAEVLAAHHRLADPDLLLPQQPLEDALKAPDERRLEVAGVGGDLAVLDDRLLRRVVGRGDRLADVPDLR